MKKLNVLTLFFLSIVFALSVTSCATDSSDKESASDESTTVETPAVADAPTEDPEAPVTANMPKTTVEWTKVEHDFGEIDKGQKQSYTFTFKNTGDNPLVIASATAGCGCTVPKKPEEPIKPGETGELEVSYNGSGNGNISKDVTVVLNTEEGVDKLKIRAHIIDPEAEDPHAGHDH